ncbi:MAG TPA: CPBP family intramembrane glutamic endopeptidase [Arenimonas sp.]|uniref:CPBP family intramembrane glutamic endopeptidase n=1 Tax=Arenimonas sp. TaxID=1872635 RepID=UPI002D80F29A|nr:CPBP family intramembrane glutamic endopeptidase [Arenimonas sp.]HEU0152186.1 CPBP family intramembrane glutamic endopeptidase [Arenimonas sp.]
MSPTSTSDDAAVPARHRWLQRWRDSPFSGATLDLLLYFAITLALTLLFAAPVAVQYQREQQYGPQRVQLIFQPCEAERWNEAAVKAVFARQGELVSAHAPDGLPITKFTPVWMLPYDTDGEREPAVLGYFELHPHTGHRPHIDGQALVQASGCPITEIRVSPLASLTDAMQSLPQRLVGPLTIVALAASGLAALWTWWLRGRRLRPPTAPMPIGRALLLATLAGVLMQAVATGLLLALRAAGLWLSPSNLEPVQALLRANLPLAFLMVAVVAPLGEELFFRHLLLRRFAAAGRPLAGLLLSAAVFGVLHELSPAEGSRLAHLAMTAIYVGMGLVFGGLYLRTGRFAAVAWAHVLANALALALLAYSAS